MWKTADKQHGRSANVLHALVNDGVTPGLTDDEIGPLNKYNGHEEC